MEERIDLSLRVGEAREALDTLCANLAGKNVSSKYRYKVSCYLRTTNIVLDKLFSNMSDAVLIKDTVDSLKHLIDCIHASFREGSFLSNNPHIIDFSSNAQFEIEQLVAAVCRRIRKETTLTEQGCIALEQLEELAVPVKEPEPQWHSSCSIL